RDAGSAHSTLQMIFILLDFIRVYSLVFGVGYFYMFRLIQTGPQPAETPTAVTDGRPARPIYAVGESLEQEKRELPSIFGVSGG
ncbi:hypothetical protein QK887_25455, partial [Salmonella enterica subsp. enterica serovar Oslo]|nr:hypothetical protein [Salmonella enterica subsp. enterica serovar Oslo]